MNETLKKIKKSAQSRKTLMAIAVICAIISTIILGDWVIERINFAINGEPDFTQLTQDELKAGLFVTGTIDAALGPYAGGYMEEGYGEKSPYYSSDLYYLVPVYSQQGDIVEFFLSFKAGSSNDRSRMNNIVLYPDDGGEALQVVIDEGHIFNLKKDQKDILEDWVTAPDYYEGGSFVDYCVEYNIMGTTDEDVILSKIVTYNIGRDYHSIDKIKYILLPLLPGLIAAGWILLIDKIQKKRKAKYKEEMDRQLQQLNADENAPRF